MSMVGVGTDLKFRDPEKARELSGAIIRLCEDIGRAVTLMHVCGSHEQAIAKYGLRTNFPSSLDVIMGPGCPVCVTDLPEVDEAVALARAGARVVTYGDMLRVPGTTKSLLDAQADGGAVEVIYSASQAVDLAREHADEQVVFFATGFETTAVATAAIALQPDLPGNFSILSAHKYILPAMEIVAGMPDTRVEGFLAAGHAATITGWGLFEAFVVRHGMPVVVAGFEPLDILAGLVQLLELVRDGRAEVANAFPRCVSREGNLNAQRQLWKVFRTAGGVWRGIAHIPDGNLRFRDEFRHVDSRERFRAELSGIWTTEPTALTKQCVCGDIMAGMKSPFDCVLFGKECLPEAPVGACMVSSEGTCKIWHTYGGRPKL